MAQLQEKLGENSYQLIIYHPSAISPSSGKLAPIICRSSHFTSPAPPLRLRSLCTHRTWQSSVWSRSQWENGTQGFQNVFLLPTIPATLKAITLWAASLYSALLLHLSLSASNINSGKWSLLRSHCTAPLNEATPPLQTGESGHCHQAGPDFTIYRNLNSCLEDWISRRDGKKKKKKKKKKKNTD